MAGPITLQLVTPERVVSSLDVEALIVPGSQGYLGILPDHAPMVVQLKAGPVVVRAGGSMRRFAVTGGFFEVADNKAIILADAAERAEEIDVERARAARDRALARLRSKQEDIDYSRARAALERALARLKASADM